MLWFDASIIIVLPALIFSIWAQINVKRTFDKYSRLFSRNNFTGYSAARKILDDNGLHNVSIERISGHLTDHYDPKSNVIRLSESVYDSNSAAAIGVAAHEAGHAVQYAQGYSPMKIRALIIPATNIGSMISMPLFFIGLLFASESLMLAGIAAYSLIAVFQLVTLPVEFNASKRALVSLENSGYLYDDEIIASKKVLTAAALTYVAALATSLLTILRLLFIAGRRN
jgi:Zn-dependent membrane protease YugP